MEQLRNTAPKQLFLAGVKAGPFLDSIGSRGLGLPENFSFLVWTGNARPLENSLSLSPSSLQPLPPGFKGFSCLSLLKTGFQHVDQAGLHLLTSGDLPTLSSQSAGIPGGTTSPPISMLSLTTVSAPPLCPFLSPCMPSAAASPHGHRKTTAQRG
ncbi:Protein GVQW1 [Plecturocebus cupreus]